MKTIIFLGILVILFEINAARKHKKQDMAFNGFRERRANGKS